jgi:hypothetical protein
MQATGMDSYNAFPYVRAALIGHATRTKTGTRVTRRGNTCAQLYKDCPTDPDSLLNYFNNHNGGLVNQVQPSVDNEVAPLIQAIVADVVGGGGGSGTSASTSGSDSFVGSDLFQTGDTLFTNAVINGATSVFQNGLSGASTIFESGLDEVVEAIVGRKK